MYSYVKLLNTCAHIIDPAQFQESSFYVTVDTMQYIDDSKCDCTFSTYHNPGSWDYVSHKPHSAADRDNVIFWLYVYLTKYKIHLWNYVETQKKYISVSCGVQWRTKLYTFYETSPVCTLSKYGIVFKLKQLLCCLLNAIGLKALKSTQKVPKVATHKNIQRCT